MGGIGSSLCKIPIVLIPCPKLNYGGREGEDPPPQDSYFFAHSHLHPIIWSSWSYNVFGANVALWECPKVTLKKKKKENPNKPFSFCLGGDTSVVGSAKSYPQSVFEDDTMPTTTILKEGGMTTPCFLSSLPFLGPTHFILFISFM